MATKTFEELKQLAIQIRDEKTNKQNTATRVGTAMLEHINKLEQDYYDKTQTDEELKERDDKLTELENNIIIDTSNKLNADYLYNMSKNEALGSFVSAILKNGNIGGGASNGKRASYSVKEYDMLLIEILNTESNEDYLSYAFYNSTSLSESTIVSAGERWIKGTCKFCEKVPAGATILAVSGKNDESVTFNVYNLTETFVRKELYENSVSSIQDKIDSINKSLSSEQEVLIDKKNKYIINYGEVGETATLEEKSSSSYTYIIQTCEAGDKFSITGKTSAPTTIRTWAFLDNDNKILSYSTNNSPISEIITAPESSKKLVANFLVNQDYAIKKIIGITDRLNVLEEELKTSSQSDNIPVYAMSNMGCLDYETFDLGKEYSLIVYYGQSLSLGVLQPTTGGTIYEEEALDGCYMMGANMTKSDGELQKMSVNNSINYNPSAITCASSLKFLLNNTMYKDINIVAITPGKGDTGIDELSNTEGEPYTLFKTQLQSLKSKANINCIAIIWMQGEADSDMDVDEYKGKMISLKNKMQSDIKSILVQNKSPLFFCYQTGRGFSPKQAEAQYQAAVENKDIILLNPVYHLPGPAHPSANGYRWYGEQCAQQLFDVLIKREKRTSVYPVSLRIKRNSVYINCIVPVPPLVIDTDIVPVQNNYGFSLFKNDEQIPIENIEIINGISIKITTTSDITDGKIKCTYGLGTVGKGIGNIRDSNQSAARTNYISDDILGVTFGQSPTTNITNKIYPLYNWLNQFKLEMQIE